MQFYITSIIVIIAINVLNQRSEIALKLIYATINSTYRAPNPTEFKYIAPITFITNAIVVFWLTIKNSKARSAKNCNLLVTLQTFVCFVIMLFLNPAATTIYNK